MIYVYTVYGMYIPYKLRIYCIYNGSGLYIPYTHTPTLSAYCLTVRIGGDLETNWTRRVGKQWIAQPGIQYELGGSPAPSIRQRVLLRAPPYSRADP
jgi:hypothetical protein